MLKTFFFVTLAKFAQYSVAFINAEFISHSIKSTCEEIELEKRFHKIK